MGNNSPWCLWTFGSVSALDYLLMDVCIATRLARRRQCFSLEQRENLFPNLSDKHNVPFQGKGLTWFASRSFLKNQGFLCSGSLTVTQTFCICCVDWASLHHPHGTWKAKGISMKINLMLCVVALAMTTVNCDMCSMVFLRNKLRVLEGRGWRMGELGGRY